PPSVSPCARWAGTEDAPTLMLCGFPGLPGGMWQISTLGAPAIAADPNSNTAPIIRTVVSRFIVLPRRVVCARELSLGYCSRGEPYKKSPTHTVDLNVLR